MKDSSNNLQTFAAGSMSGTSVIYGKPMSIRGCKTASMQAQWSGNPTGAFDFLISNRSDAVVAGVADNTKFTALTNPSAWSTKQPAGSASDFVFGFADLSHLWIMPRYTNSSGSGSCDCFLEAQ